MSRPRVAVAASGGRDSTALLHCTVRQAAVLGVDVVALHVHHGLMAAADGWLEQVKMQCRRWGADFICRRLGTSPPSGQSIEAWARRERYRALTEMARDADCGLVLLAHHRRDQAETWLLQALRGGGPAGLAAMPRQACRQGLTWARPWLEQPREAIDAYVRRHRLKHVDDDSNADPRFARSRLREAVWPALLGAFPGAEAAMARAAARAQEAAALAAEVAAADLPALREGSALRVEPWRALPPARRRNALRAYLAETLQAPVPESLVERLCRELPQRRAARWPAPPDELRLYKGALAVAAPLAQAPRHTPLTIDLQCPGDVVFAPWHGRLVVRPVASGGVPPALLRGVVVRDREGGETFRAAPGASPRSLKKQFQACGVAAWERGGPLLFTAAGALLFVPGLGIDAALRAAPGEPQLGLAWLPDARGPTGRRQPGG